MFAKALGTIGGLFLRLFFTPLGYLFLFIGRLVGERPAEHFDLNQPVTDRDLSALARWLALHKPHRGELADIHAVDGYLCRVAMGPKVAKLDEWISLMFEGQPVPEDITPMLAVMSQHMNDILNGCAQTPWRYRLLCQTHPHLGAPDHQLRAWCRGFAIGMKLQRDSWQAPYLDAQGMRWVESVLREANAAKGTRLQPHTVVQGVARLARRALKISR